MRAARQAGDAVTGACFDFALDALLSGFEREVAQGCSRDRANHSGSPAAARRAVDQRAATSGEFP
ncbi:hypothetical protein ACFWOJ_04715 [Streptomyces sp. NPDC058439]|uniref:hypothetical protein n=1 Tax=Streptomyces sp. NPDC058439 TaxID=3346500 RepID=UPI00365E1DD5